MTTTAALNTCELVVPGLCCVECSLGVVTALRRAAGVQDVRILGTAEKALVTYDAGMTGPVIAAASQAVPDVAVALNAARLLGRRQRKWTFVKNV